MDLRTAIENIIQQQLPQTLFWAKIKSTDEQNKTATIIQLQTQTEIEGVRLGLGENYFVPENDSLVLCGIIENHEAQVIILWAEKVKKYYLNSVEIIFNGGKNDGVPIANNIAERLNQIERDLNTLKQIFTAWTPVSGDGGAVLKTAAQTWASKHLTQTTKQDLENADFKH